VNTTTAALAVRPGDHVEATLKDGRQLSFAVDRSDARFLYGREGGQEIAIDRRDIVHLQIREVSVGRTGLLTLAVIGAALFAVGVYAIRHIKVDDP